MTPETQAAIARLEQWSAMKGYFGIRADIETIVDEISRADAPVQGETWPTLSADVESLPETHPLPNNLHSLATNPAVAIRAYGTEWAGWVAASAYRALRASQPAPVWISVENRLPTNEAEYVHNLLVCSEYGSRDIATYDGYAKYFEMGSQATLGGHPVTHWMYLPTVPQPALEKS